MVNPFVHLSVHTDHSLVDSVVRVKALVAAVKAADMPAVAVTEQGNLFSLVKFYRAAVAAGIKPIVGADVWVADAENSPPARLTLLSLDQDGYRHLSELLSLGYQKGQAQGVPILAHEWLEARHAGLIILAGGVRGEVGQALLAAKPEVAKAAAARWQALAPDRFYLDVQRTGRRNEERYLNGAVDLAVDQIGRAHV